MMIQKNKHSLGSDAPLSLSVMEQEAATVARKNSSKNMSSRKVANDEERSVVIRNNNANVALSTFGDQISARLDDEILKMKPTNRSSDLGRSFCCCCRCVVSVCFTARHTHSFSSSSQSPICVYAERTKGPRRSFQNVPSQNGRNGSSSDGSKYCGKLVSFLFSPAVLFIRW